MGGKIFINYRRGDDPGFAQALLGQLEQTFPREQIFIDIDNIAPGLDFVKVLEEQVALCDVLLVMIGRGWIDATDAAGRRRLLNQDDFVRIEISSAFRQNKRVIPILVNEARMPTADELPEPLEQLARCNAVRLTHERFRADTTGLVKALREAIQHTDALRETADETTERAGEKEETITQEEATQQRAKKQASEQDQLQREGIQQAAAPSAEQIRRAEEHSNWEFIRASESLRELRDHLRRFPAGATGQSLAPCSRISCGRAWSAERTVICCRVFLASSQTVHTLRKLGHGSLHFTPKMRQCRRRNSAGR